MFSYSPQRFLSPFLMRVGRKTHLRFISPNLVLQSSLKENNKMKSAGYIVITLPRKITCNVRIMLINFLSKYITVKIGLNRLMTNKDFAHLCLLSNSIGMANIQ